MKLHRFCSIKLTVVAHLVRIIYRVQTNWCNIHDAWSMGIFATPSHFSTGLPFPW